MRKNSDYQTSIKERVSYPMFAIGQGIVYLFVSGYLMLYLTNRIYLNPMIVGTILLFSKVWDAVNDPMMGVIVDRTQFRKNKFKPWLRVSTALIPLTTFLMFQIQAETPDKTKIILAVAFYFIWDMAYTMSDVPLYSLLTSMTSNVRERSSLISYGSVAGVANALLLVVVLVPKIEDEAWGFSRIAIVVALLSFAGMLPLTITGKERVREQVQEKEKTSTRDIFVYLKNNKYLFYFFLYQCLSGMLALGSLLNYVIIELLGSIRYLAIFTAIGAVPTIILYLLMPKITSRFDKMLIFRSSVIASALLSLGLYAVGYSNIVLFGIFAITKTVIATSAAMLTFTFAMDCVEYGHYKTGIRKEGITFSVQTFANKFIAAISSSLGSFILAYINYDGRMEGHQAAGTLTGLWNAYVWVPIIGVCVALPFLFLYKLRSSDVQIMADINTGKITREEGEARMSRQY